MSVRIGFHGFGRLGRNVFRVLSKRRDFDVRCIADVAPAENLVYLLNFDSIYGRFGEEVTHTDDRMFVRGRAIPLVRGKQPGDVRWRDYDVDVATDEQQARLDWLADQPGLVEFRERATDAGLTPIPDLFEGCG